jgi:hypothetical protein
MAGGILFQMRLKSLARAKPFQQEIQRIESGYGARIRTWEKILRPMFRFGGGRTISLESAGF